MKRKSIILGTVIALVLSLALPMAVSADFIDTTGPTGHYYQYAGFTVGDGSGYLGGGDVDAYGDLIYVNRDGTNLDVYQVTLLDSDGDGVLEPDQHLLNIGPDEIPGTADDQIGPMEQRTLTLVTTYNVPDLYTATVGEIYATADRVYFLGTDRGDIYQYVFATGVTSKVVDGALPAGHWNLSQLGYDDVNDVWYASSEAMRAVYSWDGSSWVQCFTYVDLAGSHMDGLEVITDPNTGIPYVYVSDMTSDYIGQWRYDSDNSSWVEENLFMYAGAYGHVEGMGFGALGHIWATTGFANEGTLYEIGGGKLSAYLPEPEPTEIEVPVDIKPTSCPNPLNVKSKGVLPVAILGTADFDVTQVDPATVQLESVSPLRWDIEDVATPFEPYTGKEGKDACTIAGPDGFDDLTLKFDKQEIVAALGDVSDGDVLVLQLTGNLKAEFGGTAIVGEDVVVILKKGKK